MMMSSEVGMMGISEGGGGVCASGVLGCCSEGRVALLAYSPIHASSRQLESLH